MKSQIEKRDLSIEPKDYAKALVAYGKLHDGLSEMIEEFRLRESDIPDDYQWLVTSLSRLATYWK